MQAASRFGHAHFFGFGVGAAVTGAIVTAVVVMAPSRRIAPERSLPPAARLSDSARAAVKTQMHAHARRMLELVSATTVLDYDAAVAASDAALAEPRVARPTSNDATQLNASLPERFFTLQDQLRSELQGVRSAAAAHDADALADSFSGAMRTCVRCHQAFLEGR